MVFNKKSLFQFITCLQFFTCSVQTYYQANKEEFLDISLMVNKYNMPQMSKYHTLCEKKTVGHTFIYAITILDLVTSNLLSYGQFSFFLYYSIKNWDKIKVKVEHKDKDATDIKKENLQKINSLSALIFFFFVPEIAFLFFLNFISSHKYTDMNGVKYYIYSLLLPLTCIQWYDIGFCFCTYYFSEFRAFVTIDNTRKFFIINCDIVLDFLVKFVVNAVVIIYRTYKKDHIFNILDLKISQEHSHMDIIFQDKIVCILGGESKIRKQAISVHFDKENAIQIKNRTNPSDLNCFYGKLISRYNFIHIFKQITLFKMPSVILAPQLDCITRIPSILYNIYQKLIVKRNLYCTFIQVAVDMDIFMKGTADMDEDEDKEL